MQVGSWTVTNVPLGWMLTVQAVGVWTYGVYGKLCTYLSILL